MKSLEKNTLQSPEMLSVHDTSRLPQAHLNRWDYTSLFPRVSLMMILHSTFFNANQPDAHQRNPTQIVLLWFAALLRHFLETMLQDHSLPAFFTSKNWTCVTAGGETTILLTNHREYASFVGQGK